MPNASETLVPLMAEQQSERDAAYTESLTRLIEAYAGGLEELDPVLDRELLQVILQTPVEVLASTMNFRGVVSVDLPSIYTRGQAGIYSPGVSVLGIRTREGQIILPRIHIYNRRYEIIPGVFALGLPGVRARGLQVTPRYGSQYVTEDVIRIPFYGLLPPSINLRGVRIRTAGLVPRITPLRVNIDFGRMPSLALDLMTGLPSDIWQAIRNLRASDNFRSLMDSRELRDAIQNHIDVITSALQDEMGFLVDAANRFAIDHTGQLIRETIGGTPDTIGIIWRDIDPRAIRNLSDYLENPAFQEILNYNGTEWENLIDSIISTGLSRGLNPIQVAQNVVRYLQNTTLSDAIRQLTTLYNYVYRDLSHEIYLLNSVENGGVVTGWIWFAHLDQNTCASCVFQHGSLHRVEEMLNDHHRGRCTPIPTVLSFADLGLPGESMVYDIERGEDWFRRQDNSTQYRILGPRAWQSWRQGGIDLSSMSTEYHDRVFGSMLRQSTYREASRRG